MMHAYDVFLGIYSLLSNDPLLFEKLKLLENFMQKT